MDELDGLEKEVSSLRAVLDEKEARLDALKRKWMPSSVGEQQSEAPLYPDPQYSVLRPVGQAPADLPPAHPAAVIGERLPPWAIQRYSRQILVEEVGVEGQARLCGARVLVAGAGGLGCPAAAYLAGAGVGVIGIVDYDTVELSNLHRQLLHGEREQGAGKVDSAAAAIRRINSHVRVNPYRLQLTSANALEVLSGYDAVLDCTDNVPTRYLLNDACVLLKIPLISGSALKLEGQLTVYGYRPRKDEGQGSSPEQGSVGPCYRCLFPSPPPPETVGSCSAQGVLGPIPGVIGTLQALEAIKLLVRRPQKELLVGRMLLLDGQTCGFRTLKLRPQSAECSACSERATVTQLLDYEAFCRTRAKEKDLELDVLPPENRISAKDLAAKLGSLCLSEKQDGVERRHLLVDVRSEPEFRMCRIDGAVNYPIDGLKKEETFQKLIEDVKDNNSEVTFLCRRGNDSQLAAAKVLEALAADGGPKATAVQDVAGGLHAWARDVDRDFPVY